MKKRKTGLFDEMREYFDIVYMGLEDGEEPGITQVLKLYGMLALYTCVAKQTMREVTEIMGYPNFIKDYIKSHSLFNQEV